MRSRRLFTAVASVITTAAVTGSVPAGPAAAWTGPETVYLEKIVSAGLTKRIPQSTYEGWLRIGRQACSDLASNGRSYAAAQAAGAADGMTARGAEMVVAAATAPGSLCPGTATKPSGAAITQRPTATNTPVPRPTAGMYSSCAAARAAGAAPLYRGQPGYNPALDGDRDGVACEPRRR